MIGFVNVSLDRISAGEEADLHGVSGHVAARDHPQAMASSSLTCVDCINPVDKLVAIADRSVSEKPRLCGLARRLS